MLSWLRKEIRQSQYDDWEWYYFLAATVAFVFIAFDIRLATDLFSDLDSVGIAYGYELDEIFVAAIQGIVISILGGHLYSQGDRHFAFLTKSFDTKETAVLVKVGLMTLLGIAVGLVIPDLVDQYVEYVVVQTTGIVTVFGYGLVHTEIVNWRIGNELPVLLAGSVLMLTLLF